MRYAVVLLVVAGCRTEPLPEAVAPVAALCACEAGPQGERGPRGERGEQGSPGADSTDPVYRGRVVTDPAERLLLLDLPATGGDVEAWSVLVAGVEVGRPAAETYTAEYRFSAVWVLRLDETRLVYGKPIGDVIGMAGSLPQFEADREALRVFAVGSPGARVAWAGTASVEVIAH
jgi:hypothetical protein